MPLTLPAGMTQTIARVARAAGTELVETGGFILGRPGSGAGTVLALTGDSDVDRQKHLFHVGGLALATLFDWAEERELSVLAQWHTHRYKAFLSDTDLEHGFNVRGFHTSVVPDYETASPDPADWGWWTYTGDEWTPAAAPAVGNAAFLTITFEKGRVHEH